MAVYLMTDNLYPDPVTVLLTGDDEGEMHSIGSCYTFGVGREWCLSSEWRRIEVDLNEVLARIDPTDGIDWVTGAALLCADACIDDLEMSAGKLRRTYQVTPGAALGGVLAVQTGAQGGEGLIYPGAKVYYQYNDLGTVHATTDALGRRVGLWIPDFYGNYAWAYTGSPARPELGLTGKLWDQDAGAYYFNCRWFDSQRGRWMSEDPLGTYADINMYSFNYSDPVNWYDLNGLLALCFDGNYLYIYGDNGELIKNDDFPNGRMDAGSSSGRKPENQAKSPDKDDGGATPRGEYDLGKMRDTTGKKKGSLGHRGGDLKPRPGTTTRTGLMIHGDHRAKNRDRYTSNGCIDVGVNDEKLAKFLGDRDDTYVLVTYGFPLNTPPDKDGNQGRLNSDRGHCPCKLTDPKKSK